MWVVFLFGMVAAHFEFQAKSPSKPLAKCPKCGINPSGKPSCCSRTGAWFDNCGLPGDSDFDHTWNEGIQACGRSATTTATALSTAPKTAATTTAHTDRNACRKCGITNKSGKLSCCARGGAWFKKCGDAGDSNFDHTWLEGVLACKSKAPTTIATETRTSVISTNGCPKCGTLKKSGTRSCCAVGGAWFNKCGNSGDSKFDHTWFEGIQACKKAPITIATETRTPAISNNGCRKCGTIKKSGKPSCCAPGGAWFNKCGNSRDSSKFDHTWFEGIQACKAPAISNNGCSKCGTSKKSGKLSCCARGGAWFKKCGDAGDSKFDHTWFDGIQACTGVAGKVQVQPYRTTIDHTRNPNENQIIISTAQSVYDADTEHSKSCSKHLTKLSVLITILILIVQICIL